MEHDPSDYEAMFDDAGIDLESLTVLLVRGGTRSDVLGLLGAAETAGDFPDAEDIEHSAYAVAEVDGGVVALEHSGFADPSTGVLAALSALGGAAAVTRSNILAHERFGCATDGAVVFDANEFMYVEAQEKEAVPAELRPLFDSAWTDISSESDDDDFAEGFVGFAMVAAHTGVVVTSEDLERAMQDGYHLVPSMTYLE